MADSSYIAEEMEATSCPWANGHTLRSSLVSK